MNFCITIVFYVCFFRSKQTDNNKGPRPVVINKTDTGFGFNVRGQVSEGGTLAVMLYLKKVVLDLQ